MTTTKVYPTCCSNYAEYRNNNIVIINRIYELIDDSHLQLGDVGI